MCDHWMPTIKLPLSLDQFRQLPRNAAYKFEYLAGEAYLSPYPRHYHALLRLRPVEGPVSVTLRPVRTDDFPSLTYLFSAAFQHTQPYGSLEDDLRLEAAQEALDRARSGGDGPWIERASFVAVEEGQPVGAVFVTLLPLGDLTDWESYRWASPPPVDAIERCHGRPHLTWIFVSPWAAGQGIGTTLLAAAVRQLLAMGFAELASTFMIGNDSSMLWHWRNGFELLQYPGSQRKRR